MSKKIILKFRVGDRDIFEAIGNGKKRVETRAATSRYEKIKPGDELLFICGKDRLDRKVKRAKVYQNIAGLLRDYAPEEINPKINSEQKLVEMYYGFPGYKEKIEKYGILAMEIE